MILELTSSTFERLRRFKQPINHRGIEFKQFIPVFVNRWNNSIFIRLFSPCKGWIEHTDSVQLIRRGSDGECFLMIHCIACTGGQWEHTTLIFR